MCLHTHSDSSYLSAPHDLSRAGRHFFLSREPKPGTPLSDALINSPIHVISKVINNVRGSAAEAEIGAGYINTREVLPICVCLEEMRHTKSPTPLAVDNITAVGLANKTIKQQMSKAIDIRFYWIQDRQSQGQFIIYWSTGTTNLADFHSKHHPPVYHNQMRATILHSSHFCQLFITMSHARVC